MPLVTSSSFRPPPWSGRWGMGFSRPPENSPIPSLPLYETAKPSNSSSTCCTSSPSPREREADSDREAVASSGFWVRSRTDESPGRGVAHPRQQQAPTSTAKTSWDRFDEPSGHVYSGTIGRDPTQRTVAFKIIIVFRGSWCTTSHSLLKGFATLNTTVRRLDGKVLALSSQTQEQVHRVQRELRLPYDVHGDPANELVEEMNRRFDMGCTITRNEMVLEAYPNGMAQPCILAVHMDNVQDRSSVLYKWSRYQTIGTVRFEDACTEIARALARRSDPTGGRPSAGATPDSQAYRLGTHQEEDEDDEDNRTSGERMDRTVGLPPMMPSNPQPVMRGMPGRSARWGSTSTSKRSSLGFSGLPAGALAAASSSTSAASSQLPPQGYGQVRWGAPPPTAGHRRRESGR